MNAYPVCLENISKKFSNDNMKQTRLNEYVYDLLGFGSFDVSDILVIYEYLMNNNFFKKFGFIEKMMIRLLASIFNGSNHTKCISLNNQPCMT